MRIRQIALWAGLGLALGCAEEPLPEGELLLSTGQELTAWDEDPSPVELRVDRIESDGARSPYETLSGETRRFSMGKGGITSFEVTGVDADGNRIVSGRSMQLVPNGLAGYRLPLFVGRVDRFSRPPGELLTSQVPTAGVVIGERHLLLLPQDVSGTVDPSGYDFGVWSPHAGSSQLACPELPCVFESVMASGAFLIAISSRWGIWFDLFAGGSGLLPVEQTSIFAELAGGSGVQTPQGDAYLIGATRDGEPTTAVLHLTTDAQVNVLRLITPRAGASATWLPERGLLVAGGSATGSGAELLVSGADAFTPLALPAEDTRGASVIGIDAETVLRAGGSLDGAPADTVALTIDCSDCTPELRGEPIPLAQAHGFLLAEDDYLVVGTDADGATAATRLRAGEVSAVPLREPRRRAVALRAPTGHVVVAGGELLDGSGVAPSLELFMP
jgi:hypothetical protein